MENQQGRTIFEPCENIFSLFSSFMERIAQFEELVTVGSRLLADFQQGLALVQRPPVEKSSKLVEQIIKVNETTRLSAYIDAGCVNVHDSVQSISKLHACHLGLKDHLSKGKDIMHELEQFLDDAGTEVNTEAENLRNLQLEDVDQDPMASFVNIPDGTAYAAMMAFIYTMVKQDYNMQERIVSSLSLKTSSQELESYCLMWTLRPFVDDEIMHKAWKLIP